MEQDNPTLIIKTRTGIRVSWLGDRGIISAAALRQRASRGKVQYLQKGGGKGNESYVDFATLDEEIKLKVCDELKCNPYEKARNTIHLSQFITLDTAIPSYYDMYKTAKGSFLPDSARAQYTANAFVLNGIRMMFDTFKQQGIPLTWETVMSQIDDLDRAQYPISLPANKRKLAERYKEYQEKGLEALIHANFKTGSQNAAKVKGDVQTNVLLTIIGNAHNISNAECARVYNQMAETLHWEPITQSTVAVWRRQNEYTIEASRKGAAAHRNKHAMTIPRKRPTTSGMWCLDGWDCELLYQEKTGKRTTYHNRLVVEMVIDLSTNYPIGYAIGDVEDADLITRALKNSIRHMQELTGMMIRPDQIQCDNFAMSKMREIYTTLAITAVTPAQVGNAKAKPIEPFFREFNDKYCHRMANWSGYGIKAKNQPNMDVLLMQKKNYPTKDELVAEITYLVNQCRQDKKQAFLEKYAVLPDERKIEIDTMTYLRLFGTERPNTVKLSNRGIELRLPEGRVQYDCFEERFREFCYVDWRIKEDPMDRTKVLAYTEGYTEQFVLETKYVQPMALADRKPGDYERLEQVLHFRKAEEERIGNRICAAQDTTRRVLEATANRDLDIQMKFLIPDSGGQQKELRYMAERMLPEATEVNPFEAAEQVEEDIDIRTRY